MKILELLEYTSYDDMVNRLKGVYNLVLRGATEGEKASAQAAYERLLTSIKARYGEEQARKAENAVKGGSQSTQSRPKSNYSQQKPKEPPKQEPPRQKQSYQSSTSGKRNGKVYYDLNGWSFHILRYTDPDAGKRGSDKIWGVASKNHQFVSFWGAYGNPVRMKNLSSYGEANNLIASKLKKGYKPADLENNLAAYAYILNQFGPATAHHDSKV